MQTLRGQGTLCFAITIKTHCVLVKMHLNLKKHQASSPGSLAVSLQKNRASTLHMAPLLSLDYTDLTTRSIDSYLFFPVTRLHPISQTSQIQHNILYNWRTIFGNLHVS